MVESPFALKAREECGGVLDESRRPCAIHAAFGRAGRESSMALNVAVQNGPIDTINIAVDSTSRSPHAGTQASFRCQTAGSWPRRNGRGAVGGDHPDPSHEPQGSQTETAPAGIWAEICRFAVPRQTPVLEKHPHRAIGRRRVGKSLTFRGVERARRGKN
jgi:hypothetical protein